MALKRPVLVGGLGLSATLWLLDTVHFSFFDSSTLLSAMALGTGIWWWRQRQPSATVAPAIQPLVADRAVVEVMFEQLQTLIQTLTTEAKEAPGGSASTSDLTQFQTQLQALKGALDRTKLNLAVIGTARSGKSTVIELIQAAAGEDAELATLSFEEIALTAESLPEAQGFAAYDGVLLLTDGDITHSSLELLRNRVMDGQGVIVAFNKTDYYDDTDQDTIQNQLEHHMATLPGAVDVVSIAAAPRPMKVRRHQPDGTVTETLEPSPVTVDVLFDSLKTSLVAHSADWVAATTLRQAQQLRREVQTELNALRRRRAQTQVDQLQWIAAAAAFANPVPTIDLLSTVAINGQLIMDLGKIYGFNLSLEEAKTAAGTLASLTVKLGLVELSTQVLTTVLKSHFATYLAGGLVQGLSAAYLTRMAGLSLMDYFEETALTGVTPTEISWESIATRLKSALQQNGQTQLLQTLARQGIERLKPSPNPALAAVE